MTPYAALTERIYLFLRPPLPIVLLHYPTNNQQALATHTTHCNYTQQQLFFSTTTNNHCNSPDQPLSPRATLRSSAISNASACSCQPRSLPAINQHICVDFYSRHHSQCLPPASPPALARHQPGLCLLSPNESLALAIAPTAKSCSTADNHAHTIQPRLRLLLSSTSIPSSLHC